MHVGAHHRAKTTVWVPLWSAVAGALWARSSLSRRHLCWSRVPKFVAYWLYV